jgi:putative ABC transport system ATP-binding protein
VIETTGTTGRDVIRRTLTRNKANVTVGTALICLHQLAETAVPIMIGVLIDRGIEPGRLSGIVMTIAVLAALFLVITVCYQAGMRRLNVALQNEAHHLRMEVSGRALSPHGLRTDLARGELLTVSSNDAEQAAWFLDLFPRMAAAAAAVIATAIALVVIDVSLGVAVLIGTPLFLALLKWATPLITARAIHQQSRVAKATALAGDLIAGLRSIKGIGAEAAASGRYRTASRAALTATLSTTKSMAVQRGVTTAMSALIAAAIAAVAGWYALTGRITTGGLIAVVGLAQFLIEPMTTLSGLPAVVARARGSAERVATVLSAPPLLTDGAGGVGDRAGIRLRDVYHRSLSGIDFDATDGEIVGVFPHDPVDGDALAALLSGKQEPAAYRGRVEVCGTDPSAATVDAVRRSLVAEPHVTDLFSGTIRDNVSAGAADIDNALLAEVLRASAADQVVAQFPDGIDHRLTDRGRNLSGGQRQRLALARALYSNAPVLVLHEPSTAVDSVTEQHMAEGIRRLRDADPAHRVATVVITTSPALLAMADRVAVLRDGRVAAAGTHHDLLADDQTYAEAVMR